ncbi:MAG: hypothetical protein QOE19_3728 [Actinomycetota bacterium]|nr:hypothetical protein [Actinomycetota bacterium]
MQPPSQVPSGAERVCTVLHGALPQRLDGRPSVTVSPRSPYTAAWGGPPLVLRCGVAKPAGLRATSEVIDIDGVEWFLVQTDDAYVFTTVGRVAYVEARVPSSVPREEATAPLVDLARPVIQSVPTTADALEGP